MHELYDFASEPDNKAVTLQTCEFVKSTYGKHFRTGSPFIKCLDEKLFTASYGLTFRAFSPFFEEFDDSIGQMISVGLPLLLEKKSTVAPEDVGPQVLDLENLEAAFLICFIPFTACTAVFILEISIPALKKSEQKLTFFFLFMNHINKYSNRY